MKSLKLAVLILSWALATAAFSKEKIVVAKATGLPALYKKTASFLRKPLFNKVQKKAFKKGLERLSKSAFEIQVLESVDAHSLFTALRDPEVVGLIFVGHLRQENNKGIGIVDDYGFDLTPVLQNMGENLRYVALMGCNSQDLIDELGGEFPGVRFLGFNEKIPLSKKVFDSVARQTLEGLKATNRPLKQMATETGTTLEITRICPGSHREKFLGLAPAVTLSFEGEKAIASLPPCLGKGEIQKTLATVPKLQEILVASVGKNALVSETQFLNEFIGTIKVRGPGIVSEMQMDLFDETRPLGITEHVIELIEQ